MFKIGNVEIKNQVVLAPMAGISNTSFRKIIKEMGAGLMYAEMVSDKAICYQSKKTFDLLKMDECERPIAQQIFGSDVEDFVKAAKIVVETQKPDILDINMGCPVPKVAIKNQAGSALLKNPEKIKEIVSRVVATVDIPVTVKIRSGWDEEHINAVEVAKACESAGASAIAVHARTRSQGYSGHADQEWLLNFVYSFIKKPKHIFLVHGEPNGQLVLKNKIVDTTQIPVTIPGYGEKYTLDDNFTVEKKYEDPIDKRYLRLEVLDRIETLQEEIEDMKNIIKEDLLSKERSDDDVKRVNEKVKELEQRIVDIIENS